MNKLEKLYHMKKRMQDGFCSKLHCYNCPLNLDIKLNVCGNCREDFEKWINGGKKK